MKKQRTPIDPVARARSLRRQRGMNHLSLTLETAAVMSWFVFMMLGEKLVGDATAARRSVANSTQESARLAGASFCGGGSGGSGGSNGTSGGFTAQSALSLAEGGKPTIGEFMSIISLLGFGSQSTMKLFSQVFKSATATAHVDDVKAAAILGGNSFSFSGEASAGCREKPLDKKGTSITDYRNSVYITQILGWIGH